MALLALLPILATRWRHLHWLKIWPSDGTTCIFWVCISDLLQIDSKFGHQVTSLALLGSKVGRQVVSLALPWNALFALSVCIEFESSSSRVTSVKFQKGVSVCLLERTGPIDRTPGIPGSDKYISF